MTTSTRRRSQPTDPTDAPAVDAVTASLRNLVCTRAEADLDSQVA